MSTQEIGPLTTQNIPIMMQIAIDPESSLEDRIACLTNAFMLTGSQFNQEISDLKNNISHYKHELKTTQERLNLCTDYIVLSNERMILMNEQLENLKQEQRERVDEVIEDSIRQFKNKGHYHASTSTASTLANAALFVLFPPSILLTAHVTAKELENSLHAYQFENKLRKMIQEDETCFGTNPKQVRENIEQLWQLEK